MREMYGHLQNIAVITDLFFAHVSEVLGLAVGKHREADKVVEQGIEIRNNTVQLTASPEEVAAKPQLLMRVFLVASRFGVPVHHRSRKIIGTNLSLFTDKERTSPRVAKTFLAILENGKDVAEVLGVMLETGLLAAYLPEFAKIITLAQHDIYHIYTVDRHSLQAVEELRRVVDEERAAVELVESTRVLFLAMLLHDIGKGSGGDHSTVGAQLVGSIGARMGFTEEECDDLRFAVQYHLFMPENAMRRDLNDSDFVKRCAEEIGTSARLGMLYLLSIADSKATGPSAWSEWKSALLEEMFLKIKPYLEHSRFSHAHAGLVESQVEQGVHWLRQLVVDLLKDEDGIRFDVDELSPDYLLSFQPEVVIEHLLIHRDNYNLLRQKSLIFASETNEQWSLLIMANDQPGLLAKICGVMALNNLTVLNARIFTWKDGTVVDVLDVRPTDGLTFAERDWSSLNNELDLAINHRLGLSHRLYEKLSGLYGRKLDLVSRQEPRVVIDNITSSDYTVVEVYGSDRPGQLYRITQTLADFGINIHKAFIATEVEQLIDVFYVLDKAGKKIKDNEFIREITNGLVYSIGLENEKK